MSCLKTNLLILAFLSLFLISCNEEDKEVVAESLPQEPVGAKVYEFAKRPACTNKTKGIISFNNPESFLEFCNGELYVSLKGEEGREGVAGAPGAKGEEGVKGDKGDQGSVGDSILSTVDLEGEVPDCDSSRVGQMIYVRAAMDYYYCDGFHNMFLGLSKNPCEQLDLNSPFAGGSGSPKSPYLICSPEQLANISRNICGASADQSCGQLHFRLKTNLDLIGHKNLIINPRFLAEGDGVKGFTGSFNGEGRKISNIHIDESIRGNSVGDRYYGFFSTIEEGAQVSNIKFDGIRISGFADDADWTFIGGVAARQLGRLNNIEIKNLDIRVIGREGEFTLTDIGGIAGLNTGDMNRVSASGKIMTNLKASIGGLAGVHSRSLISLSYADIEILAGYADVGGLVSDCRSEIINSYAIGRVNQDNEKYGGFAYETRTASCVVKSSYSSLISTQLESQAIGRPNLIHGITNESVHIINSYFLEDAMDVLELGADKLGDAWLFLPEKLPVLKK